MIYVIAGNHAQYVNWCKQNGYSPRQAIYAVTPECWIGCILQPEDRIVKFGTWYGHPNILDIEREIQIAEMRRVK